jgi:hypothetical protein
VCAPRVDDGAHGACEKVVVACGAEHQKILLSLSLHSLTVRVCVCEGNKRAPSCVHAPQVRAGGSVDTHRAPREKRVKKKWLRSDGAPLFTRLFAGLARRPFSQPPSHVQRRRPHYPPRVRHFRPRHHQLVQPARRRRRAWGWRWPQRWSRWPRRGRRSLTPPSRRPGHPGAQPAAGH